jgi:hypothetical protein
MVPIRKRTRRRISIKIRCASSFQNDTLPAISLSQPIIVFSLTFNVGASAYTITCPAGQFFTIGNGGLTNNSSVPQNFLAGVDETGNSLEGFNSWVGVQVTLPFLRMRVAHLRALAPAMCSSSLALAARLFLTNEE